MQAFTLDHFQLFGYQQVAYYHILACGTSFQNRWPCCSKWSDIMFTAFSKLLSFFLNEEEDIQETDAEKSQQERGKDEEKILFKRCICIKIRGLGLIQWSIWCHLIFNFCWGGIFLGMIKNYPSDVTGTSCKLPIWFYRLLLLFHLM